MKTPFERAVISHLSRRARGERFELREGCDAQLLEALERELSNPDPLPGIERALRLIAAFDTRLRSPSIAGRLRRLLKSDPRAVKWSRALASKEKGLEELRAFAMSEGRETVVSAPRYGEGVPENAIPLRDFLIPSGRRSRG